MRDPFPQTIRLTVPGALPSIRISRGATTTASAIAGFVMAMRVTSKSVPTTVERPAVSCTRGNCGRGPAPPAARRVLRAERAAVAASRSDAPAKVERTASNENGCTLADNLF